MSNLPPASVLDRAGDLTSLVLVALAFLTLFLVLELLDRVR